MILLTGILFSTITRHELYTNLIWPGEIDTTSLGKSVLAEYQIQQVLKSSDNRTVIKAKLRSIREAPTIKDRFILVRIKNWQYEDLLPGDIMQAKGKIFLPDTAMNPKSFDAKKYYHSIGIRYTFITSSDSTCLWVEHKSPLHRIPAAWQKKLSNITDSKVSSPTAQLANALVWGYRGDMDQEIMDSFSRSGAMHVLSVSGMHVAMIYSMLFLILRKPDRGARMMRIGKWIIYTSCILLYVLVTGCSAAAMRSGIMIILFITGKAFFLNTNIWNVMGVSALGQMWLEPLIVHQLGFILSFLAMTGMLLYTESFDKSWLVSRKWARWVWTIASVSLAAQVFILPVLLSTFHTFPLTFIASSIISIPGGYVVIFGCLLNLVLNCFQLEIGWYWFDLLVTFFLQAMEYLASFSPIMHFAMPVYATSIFFLTILLFTLGWYYQWKSCRHISLCMLGVLVIMFTFHRIQMWNKAEIVFYSSTRGFVIDHFYGRDVYSLLSPGMTKSSVNFMTYGYRSFRDIGKVEVVPTVETKDRIIKSEKYSYLLLETDRHFSPDFEVKLICLTSRVHDESLMQYLDCYPETQILLHTCLYERIRKHYLEKLNHHPFVFDMKSGGAYQVRI